MKKAVLISIATYLLFFFKLLNPQLTIYSGKDSTNFFYPSRYYLHEKLMEGEFPFYTERIYSGFPIYADPERAYLHPLNVAATYVFGPINSYKILHLTSYLLGSMGLYLLLKKRGISLAGFSVANIIYFFSFFHLYHQQHFGMILATYTLPMIIYLIEKVKKSSRVRYAIFLALALLNTFYFGNIQIVSILLGVSLIYLLILKADFKKILLTFGLFAVLSLPLALPLTELYQKSLRMDILSYTEGSFAPSDILNVFVPYLYGNENYSGVKLDAGHLKHEIYVYMGITSIIFGIAGFSVVEDKKLKLLLKLLSAAFLIAFIGYVPLIKDINIPLLSLFRYWGRLSFLLGFVIAVSAAHFIGKKITVRCNKNIILIVFLFLILALLNLGITKDALYLIRNSHELSIGLVAFGALAVLATINSWKKLAVLLVFLDLFYFGSKIGNMYIPTVDIPKTPETSVPYGHRLFFPAKSHNNGLYIRSWGILGYTPLVDANYQEYLTQFGYPAAKTRTNKLHTPGERIFQSIFKNSDGSLDISDLEEGYIKVHTNFTEDTAIETYIRNYKGWVLIINGVGQEFSNEADSIFLEWDQPAGKSTTELIFKPWKLK